MPTINLGTATSAAYAASRFIVSFHDCLLFNHVESLRFLYAGAAVSDGNFTPTPLAFSLPSSEVASNAGSAFHGNHRGRVCRHAWLGRGARAPGENRMTMLQALANVAVGLAIYLLYALLRAEKF